MSAVRVQAKILRERLRIADELVGWIGIKMAGLSLMAVGGVDLFWPGMLPFAVPASSFLLSLGAVVLLGRRFAVLLERSLR